MMRLPIVRVGFALMLLLCLTVSASANETKGTIRSVKTDKQEIVLMGILSDTTYELNKDAKVCLDGKQAKLDDLRKGDRVTINFEKSGDRLMASEVRALRKSTDTTGAVRSVVSDKQQLILKGIFKDTTYQLKKGATVWMNGKQGHLADLHEGDRVELTFGQRGDQRMVSAVRYLGK